MIYCKYCGTENSKQVNFCKNCGRRLEKESIQAEQKQDAPERSFETVDSFDHTPVFREPAEREVIKRHSKSTNRTVVALVTVLTVLVIVLAGVVGWIILSDRDSDSNSKSSSEVKEIQINKTEDDEIKEEPFDRFSTYSPGYTYENMDEIHNSIEATDKESYRLKAVIEDYNSKWIDYVNYGNEELFGYLRVGTTAYDYAIGFSDTDIRESFLLMEVNDVRKAGNTYFVWSHEKIHKSSPTKGEWVKEYHWVYKIRKESGNFYVEDYTADPYYKN